MLSALNLAYEEQERRSFLRFQAIGLLMTLCAIVGGVAGDGAAGAAAGRHQFRRARRHARQSCCRTGSFGVLVAVRVAGAVAALPLWPVARAGALALDHAGLAGGHPAVAGRLGAVLVLRRPPGSYDATYGPLGAVAGVMMWFWMSAYAALLGAELNAELELQTAEDTTTGEPKPIGSRGAFVADNVADE